MTAAQASIAASAKGQLVGEAMAAGDRLERKLPGVAGAMPGIGVPDPTALDGTAVLPALDAADPGAAAAAPIEMAALTPGAPPSEPEPPATVAAPSAVVRALSPAPPRSSEAVPEPPAHARARATDPAPPVVSTDPAAPVSAQTSAEPRSSAVAGAATVAHAATSEPAMPDTGVSDTGTPAPRLAHAVAPIRITPPDMRGPTWLQNAVAPVIDDRPAIAVVIDDLGVNHRGTTAVSRLEGPLTLAFLPYAPHLSEQTRAARAAGHELMLHVPMEPTGNAFPGPNALLASLEPADLVARLRSQLRSFRGFVGINNHMGSLLTADDERMSLVMAELRRHGLLFLDSRTTAHSVAGREARRLQVPYAERDVFLDNELDLDAVLGQLERAETIARRKGYAVAIGHPHDVTIEALRRWLPTLDARGFALAPISAIVARRACAEGAPVIDDACARYTAVASLPQ